MSSLQVTAPLLLDGAIERRTTVEHFAAKQFDWLDVYHLLWEEIHTKKDPTLEWFMGWLARIPNGDCGCLSWLHEYITNNPPDFEIFPVWAWRLHNAVNAKLGKSEMAFSDAVARWAR